ncbi:transporter substrate-binding domain-containing protein [Streptomyces sp. BE20]|uniref:transporter substrate-binding domain-containing protein n=1 Tax=Streptomyces sp. BE20 TaxID=3002525 RepID=UPI002E7A2A82|nr:transporter substrate-binding domain-containing protein [Streptomyces sp. BE20]MEE1825667.1 transporter substrate-binding domain-containing protein [Streptomyces sp. BE20]
MCPGDDFKDPPGDPAGLDPELARAIGRHLGLRVAFTDLPFDRLIPAVRTGHPDLAMSAVVDTRQRRLGAAEDGCRADAAVDFVDHLATGTSMVVKAGNPLDLSAPESSPAARWPSGTAPARTNRLAGRPGEDGGPADPERRVRPGPDQVEHPEGGVLRRRRRRRLPTAQPGSGVR